MIIDQIATLRGKVNRMRQGGAPESAIRAGLIAEGWATETVTEAMLAAPMTRPGSVEHDT